MIASRRQEEGEAMMIFDAQSQSSSRSLLAAPPMRLGNQAREGTRGVWRACVGLSG